MCNKHINIGKFYAEDILSEKKEYAFLCDVYSEEKDNSTKFYAKLNDGRIFEVFQDSDYTFSLQIDMDHQYNLLSEDKIIAKD